MEKLTNAIYAVVAAIITLAIVSVILSRNSQTPAVIQSIGSFLAGLVKAAVTPVSN